MVSIRCPVTFRSISIANITNPDYLAVCDLVPGNLSPLVPLVIVFLTPYMDKVISRLQISSLT